jgi:hypothetical protein
MEWKMKGRVSMEEAKTLGAVGTGGTQVVTTGTRIRLQKGASSHRCRHGPQLEGCGVGLVLYLYIPRYLPGTEVT